MPSSTPLALRAVELGDQQEYLVFFAADEADLPDEAVMSELEVVVLANGDAPTRGGGSDLLRDFLVGLGTNATWTGVLATLTATVAYLRRRRPSGAGSDGQLRATVDLVEVKRRIDGACLQILGSVPTEPDNVDIRRNEDGTWSAVLEFGNDRVQATLDATGAILLFRRVATN